MSISILSNVPANAGQRYLAQSMEELRDTSERLCSGKRITNPADDPASLAIASGFYSDQSSAEIAINNTKIGGTVTAMVAGAFDQVEQLLRRVKDLSTQANSDALGDVQRGFLNVEAQQLIQELDRIAESTQFNGIQLINGSLAGGGALETNINGANDYSSIVLRFNDASTTAANTNVFVLNGVQFAAGTTYNYDSTNNKIQFNATDTAIAKATELVNIINNTSANINQSSLSQVMKDRLSDLTAIAAGGTVTISSKRMGVGGTFSATFDAANTDDIMNIQSGIVTLTSSGSVLSSYGSGAETGSLGISNIQVIGTMGNNILQPLSQVQATSGLIDIAASDLQDGNTIQAFGRSFTLKDNLTNSSTQIKRSTYSDAQTLKNVVTFLNNSEDPAIANFIYEAAETATGQQIKVTAKGASGYQNNITFTVGTNSFEVDASSGGILPADGVAQGIDVSHVTDNENFVGKINNFSAEMLGTNNIKLSVKVGSYVYEAVINNTAPTVNTPVRMKSIDLDNNGGYFDIIMAANNGIGVSTQTDANTFANNINNAIQELTFYQTRTIDSFDVTNTIIEESVASLVAQDFDVDISSIEIVNSQNTTNQQGKITMTAKDGRVFENSSLNEVIDQGQKVDFSNTANSNEKITIIFGRKVDLSDQAIVNELGSVLSNAFSVNKRGMQFQIGLKSTDTISISISSTQTRDLFQGQTIDISTVEDAQQAADILDSALDQIRQMNATIGAFQARFSAAAQNLESAQQSYYEALSVLLDANMPEETTKFAGQTVRMNAAIKVIASLNDLTKQLLQLL